MKFNFKNKETNKESFEKKHCVATSCRGKWQELTKVRIAFSKRLRQYFPRVRNNYLLRRETCSVFYDTFENFLRTLTFFRSGILNFELNCFRLYPSDTNIMQNRLHQTVHVPWKFSGKWNEQVKFWKQRLRYRIVGNERSF